MKPRMLAPDELDGLLRRIQRLVRAHLRRKGLSPEDVEDVTQTVLMELAELHRKGQLDPDLAPGLAKRRAASRLLDYWKAISRRTTAHEGAALHAALAEVTKRSLAEDCALLFAVLDAEHKVVLSLILAGCSARESARVLDVAPGTIINRRKYIGSRLGATGGALASILGLSGRASAGLLLGIWQWPAARLVAGACLSGAVFVAQVREIASSDGVSRSDMMVPATAAPDPISAPRATEVAPLLAKLPDPPVASSPPKSSPPKSRPLPKDAVYECSVSAFHTSPDGRVYFQTSKEYTRELEVACRNALRRCCETGAYCSGSLSLEGSFKRYRELFDETCSR